MAQIAQEKFKRDALGRRIIAENVPIIFNAELVEEESGK